MLEQENNQEKGENPFEKEDEMQGLRDELQKVLDAALNSNEQIQDDLEPLNPNVEIEKTEETVSYSNEIQKELDALNYDEQIQEDLEPLNPNVEIEKAEETVSYSNEQDKGLLSTVKGIYKNDKPKFIAGVLLFVVPIAFLIVYALNSGTKKENQIEEFEIPVSETDNYNSKVEAINQKKREKEVGEFENLKIDTVEAIHYSDNVNSNVQTNQEQNYNQEPSNNRAYGDNSMYTTSNQGAKKKYYEDDYNYFEEPREKPKKKYSDDDFDREVTKEESKPKSKWVRTKYGIVNSDYFVSNSKNRVNNEPKKNIAQKLYKANIYVSKPMYITPERNRVQIRVIEPFSVNGVQLKQGQKLVAYASFGNTLKLNINSVLVDGERIPLNISVLDNQGQEDIQIIGQTGDDIKNDVKDEAFNEATTNNNLFDKAVGLLKGKKKTKVLISNEYVYLRVN